ncbi:MAG: DUF1833 family protein [Mizugakiibacter sp.]|uniref:DUF1833 family protein n=1 Tax=Mizugakiibacter sp. TaxID=1972610 RepID=UPI00320C2106
MSRQVSQAALQAMLAQHTGEVFLVCVRIAHPDISTIRIVNNTQAITRTDGVYQPYPIRARLPDQRDDQIPQVQLIVDNVDRSVLEAIRTISGVPTVTLEVVLASSPNTIEAGPFEFDLLGATYDALVITGTLGYEDDLLSQPIPALTYTPTNSPGLVP